MPVAATPTFRTRQYAKPLIPQVTINYEGAGTFYSATATSAAIDMPDGVAAGDTLVVFLQHAAADVRPPNGWTDAGWPNITTTQKCYRRLAGSEEPAAYTWRFSSSVFAEAVCVRISGAHPTAPFIYSAPSSGTGVTATALGITPPTVNSVLLAHVQWGGTRDTSSDGAVMTEVGDGANISAYVEELTSDAATGNRTFTISSSATWNARLISVRD